MLSKSRGAALAAALALSACATDGTPEQYAYAARVTPGISQWIAGRLGVPQLDDIRVVIDDQRMYGAMRAAGERPRPDQTINGVYVWADHTIYLNAWTFTPGTQSRAVLAHEIAHHYQARYHGGVLVGPCRNLLEAEAYNLENAVRVAAGERPVPVPDPGCE
ncbi:hypothetical protein [Nitrospirillum iridis]|uniref:DUF4157 domain-containing protein n=1 Tax=Nitrospirillum iridis TaxID=765888 RepID=A0A7X0EFF8_9PROT|nr:hypothetical protein [Nitrospirillum iridis]MBB6253006.1 hypothetical protein [Nitrospirillum iridis]